MNLNPWHGLKGMPKSLWVLFFVSLVNRLGTMAMPFLALYLTQERGHSAAFAGAMISVFGISALVTSLLIGRWIDRLGPINIMLWSLLATAGVVCTFPFFESKPALTVLIVFWGMSVQAFRPAHLVVLSDALPAAQRRSAFAMARLAANLGMSVGPALGGVIAPISFVAVFLVDGITTFVAWALLAFSKKEFKVSRGAVKAETEANFETIRDLKPLKNPLFMWFMLSFLLVLFVFEQHTGPLSIYIVRDLKMEKWVFGSIFTVNTIMVVVLELFVTTRTATWSALKTLALSAFLQAIGFAGFAVVKTHAQVLLTTSIWTLGEILMFTSAAAFVAEVSPARRKGEYMGYYSMTYNIAQIVGPLLGMYLLEHQGGRTLWLGSGVVDLSAVVFFLAGAWFFGTSRKKMPRTKT